MKIDFIDHILNSGMEETVSFNHNGTTLAVTAVHITDTATNDIGTMEVNTMHNMLLCRAVDVAAIRVNDTVVISAATYKIVSIVQDMDTTEMELIRL